MSARLQVIRESLPLGGEENISFKHVVSSHNIADCHTRINHDPPWEIPWWKGDLQIDESFHTTPGSLKVTTTTDLKMEEIQHGFQNNTVLQPIGQLTLSDPTSEIAFKIRGGALSVPP